MISARARNEPVDATEEGAQPAQKSSVVRFCGENATRRDRSRDRRSTRQQ
jgi:hypothetical protein